MSRIGKRPVELPKGATLTAGDGFFEVKGPKGSVRRALPNVIELTAKDGFVHVSAKADVDAKTASRLSGTARSHVNNAVIGVTKGFTRNLKLEGTGYRAELKGSTLTLALGLSHPVVYEIPKALSVKIPADSKNTVLALESVDKDVLGQAVAQLQSFRPPEPYKGKGVRIEGVKIRQKAGKAGKGKGK
jgi:large subunit ribosomal protein L6